ncbi:uncharacterized protein LOC109794227 [Cajanus cajan]|uniref:Neprosin PEP catalytic domain-containing protein n=1 Tax=Cajanus cajan TaxID=3821 RepID=A0A151U5B1_CAJCA|nr:uncharacterized protein LOC109794227 [Cajanus cajan]KYP74512.1 hypothetical protein KK1_007196 [Cajanus cajan]
MGIIGRMRRPLEDHHLLLMAFFVAILLQRAVVESGALNDTRYRHTSSLRLERIKRHLEKINKPPVLTIESPDGDLIDCVDERKQLAFDHPLLKNHKIQKMPTEMPGGMKVERDTSDMEGEGISQMWHLNGTRCPKGTVPIRRTTVQDVLRAKSLYHFGKKRSRVSLSRRNDALDILGNNGHEYAVAYTESSQNIFGAKATINVWDPSIQVRGEFSLSQIWVLSGAFEGPDLNSIEAGWQVSPKLYGDNRPRLFSYWTRDTYRSTGCYNLLCAGFVQKDARISIGAAISPLSSYAGKQYDISILVWKDPKEGNWWMSFGANTLIGYWPKELFTNLADHATAVEWGGEVVNTRTNGQHTFTQMGSGHFAEEGFGKASYFRNLQLVDSNNKLIQAQDVSTLAPNSNCYNIKMDNSNDWGTFFFYGGPGNNPKCP